MEEGGNLRALVLMLVLVLGMHVGESSVDSFKDCYVKCFVFCMIEPSQTLCSCSTTCLKSCIFPADSHPFQLHHNDVGADNFNDFCKLGCASSLCSNISTKHNPNGEKMENCVGSCSKRCTKKN
ncbi:hypothetical protein LguiA_028640 [Lonicera macranthoides]